MGPRQHPAMGSEPAGISLTKKKWVAAAWVGGSRERYFSPNQLNQLNPFSELNQVNYVNKEKILFPFLSKKRPQFSFRASWPDSILFAPARRKCLIIL
jgi:hypothetical protein